MCGERKWGTQPPPPHTQKTTQFLDSYKRIQHIEIVSHPSIKNLVEIMATKLPKFHPGGGVKQIKSTTQKQVQPRQASTYSTLRTTQVWIDLILW